MEFSQDDVREAVVTAVIPFVVRDRAGATSPRFGAGEAAGAPQVGRALPASRAARDDVGPGVEQAAGRVRETLDDFAGRDLAAAISAVRRAMESPGLTTTERKALAGALATVAGVMRVRDERRRRAENDWRARQCPRGDW
ncbi:MAG: hypothetical protein RDU30_09760 [Desulfovibrionaceae bacterium]|nr:hypothetical protein [Desulfovibrionaceae bacterium]